MAEERNQEELMKDISELQADELLITGAILVLIGSLTTALSITNIFLTRSQQGGEGVVLGHGIESIGNTFHVAGKEKQLSYEPIEPRFTGMIGSATQALANMGIAVTIQKGLSVGLFNMSDMEDMNGEENGTNGRAGESAVDEEQLRRILILYAILSVIQSFGAYTEGYSISRVPLFETQQLEASGDYITALGAAIEVGAISLELQEAELLGIFLAVIASWVQFVGSSIGFYSLTTQGALNQREFDEKYRYSYSRYTT